MNLMTASESNQHLRPVGLRKCNKNRMRSTNGGWVCEGRRSWTSVPHGREMSCDDVQSLNRVFRDLVKVTRQSFQQHLEADHRHPLQGHLERLILPLPRQSHLQIHLTDAAEVKRSLPVKHRNVNASSLNTRRDQPCLFRLAVGVLCTCSSSHHNRAVGLQRSAS